MSEASVRRIVHIDEEKCDGCGQCVPACEEGAIRVIDGKARLLDDRFCDGLGACLGECPQGAISIEERHALGFDEPADGARPPGVVPSRPDNWPIQLRLVPPSTPWLEGADLLLCADCTAFALSGLPTELLQGRQLIIACPKLDDTVPYLAKLTEMYRSRSIRSVTVVRMEVPCCSGLTALVRQAIDTSGAALPLREVVVALDGRLLDPVPH